MKAGSENSVSFIGSGNVATHLATGLHQAGVIIDSIYSPTGSSRHKLAHQVQSRAVKKLEDIDKNSGYYIISVPDDKIEEVISKMPDVQGVIAHTSGITSLKIISKRFENSGVLYPLQTFSKSKDINLKEVPFCIEGNNNSSYNKLFQLANLLSNQVNKINSDERKQLHLAAVFVSNFVNHLYHAAFEILQSSNLSFDMLKPLITEVAAKVNELSPADAQTGPARRKDKKTIEMHKKMLQKHPGFLALYQLITQQIIDNYYE